MGLFGIGAEVLGRGFSKTQVAIAAAGVATIAAVVHFASR
jgi:hypothetical protein